MKAAALAHPNIAFIKYWGNSNDTLRLPANGSISMNLESLYTRTEVNFKDGLSADQLLVNGVSLEGEGLQRVRHFMDEIRRVSGEERCAEIVSENNFPMGAGIASSAAAFAALALAGSAAAGLELSESEVSRLARMGSGSACRSVPDGFCEWLKSDEDAKSVSVSLAPATHWELTDLIAVVNREHKKVGSSAGHSSASSSPYQESRVADAPARLAVCRSAISEKDFSSLAEVSERDQVMMHSVMMTQKPPLFYWQPLSLKLMRDVAEWREEGLQCFATLDAGPNVHILCPAETEGRVREKLERIDGIREIIASGPGGKAVLL